MEEHTNESLDASIAQLETSLVHFLGLPEEEQRILEEIKSKEPLLRAKAKDVVTKFFESLGYECQVSELEHSTFIGEQIEFGGYTYALNANRDDPIILCCYKTGILILDGAKRVKDDFVIVTKLRDWYIRTHLNTKEEIETAMRQHNSSFITVQVYGDTKNITEMLRANPNVLGFGVYNFPDRSPWRLSRSLREPPFAPSCIDAATAGKGRCEPYASETYITPELEKDIEALAQLDENAYREVKV